MAINGDWFWDQYEVTKKGGELDLSSDQTSYLDSLTDLNKETVIEYENRFIDELYGTDDAKWESEQLPYRDNAGDGALDNLSSRRGSVHLDADRRGEYSMVTWGLDLRRTMVDDDGRSINRNNSDEYYDHITKGDVNWASYENDVAYQKAFEDMKKESSASVGQAHDIGDLMRDTSFTDKQRVDFVRAANERMDPSKKADDPDNPDWRHTWDGKLDRKEIYRGDAEGNLDSKGDLYIDGERQETLSERYAEDEGRLKIGFEATNANGVKYTVADDGTVDPSAFDPIAGPPTAVVRPNIEVKHPRVNVPKSLAPWKSLAKPTVNAANLGGNK